MGDGKHSVKKTGGSKKTQKAARNRRKDGCYVLKGGERMRLGRCTGGRRQVITAAGNLTGQNADVIK